MNTFEEIKKELRKLILKHYNRIPSCPDSLWQTDIYCIEALSVVGDIFDYFELYEPYDDEEEN